MNLKRRKRVRMHLIPPHPSADLPSIEGLLISRRGREYVLALPQLHLAAGGNPAELEAQLVEIPRERIAFFEVVG